MKENLYQIMKEKQQKEFNKFPIQFAFSDEQFKEGMKKLGLTENDTDKVFSIGNGGFLRKTDADALNEMFKRFNEEMENAIENDKDGTGFIKDMFYYELANHEYGYTYELDDTLEALGLTIEEIESNDKLKRGLQIAKRKCLGLPEKPKQKNQLER